MPSTPGSLAAGLDTHPLECACNGRCAAVAGGSGGSGGAPAAFRKTDEFDVKVQSAGGLHGRTRLAVKFRLRQGKSETKWAFSNEAKWGGLSWATASEITDADKRRFREVVEQGGVQPVARGGSKPRADSPLLPAVRGSQRLEAQETARLAAAAMALPVATEPGALGAPPGDDLALLAASGAVAEQAGVRDEVVRCVQRLKDEVVRRTRVEKERAQERARRLQSYARAVASALLARANQRLRGALGKKRRSSWGRYNRDHARDVERKGLRLAERVPLGVVWLEPQVERLTTLLATRKAAVGARAVKGRHDREGGR